MGALMRALDWSTTSLGPPSQWPQSLRTVVRLMLNTGHPVYVFWGREQACLYNDAYRRSIGPERHPSSVGRPAYEVWEEIWDVIGPQIARVMGGGGATWNVDQLVPMTRNGRREEVYWTYSYSPIDDDNAAGGIGGVMVMCTETTGQVLAAQSLAAERDRFAMLFEQAPGFMALLSGPTHRFEAANPNYIQLVGHRDVIGRTVAEALPEVEEQGYIDILDRVFETGTAFAANGAHLRLQAFPGAPAEERFLDFVYQPLKDGGGKVMGILVQGIDITHRAAIERELRDTQARLRAALTAGRMGSWETDYRTRTRAWSEEGMALFGLDLPGGRGRVGGPDDELVAALHPDDRHLIADYLKLEAEQDSFEAEYRIVRPDGTVLWLAGRGLVVSRLPDGGPHRLVSFMADATEHKLARESLRVQHERLDLALGAGHMGAFDMHLQSGELWWSKQTFALFGKDPTTFVPTPAAILELLHPEDQEVFMRVRAKSIEEHRPYALELRTHRPDGGLAWLLIHGQAEYDAAGRALRNFGVIMDITERKEAEESLRDADRKKDRFIATLAHELRNPLAPIRNAIQLLRRLGDASAKAAWCHDVIDRQVTQMARLLDDLLDASRLSRGQLRLRPQRLDLGGVIEQAIEIAQPLIDASGHALTVDLPVEAMPMQGDLTRLAQVFSNVLINAAKYTPQGGSIALAAARDAATSEAVVRIKDSGIGIDQAHLLQIFEMFGQVESSSPRGQDGQGIGLALAKGLVEMHGGTITARSAGTGQGSEFEIRLPLAALESSPEPAVSMPSASASAAPPVAATASAVSEADRPKHHILVADDLRDSADSLAFSLEARGHKVNIAYDGEQALQLARTLQPAIVVLDLGMPKLSGYDVCRAIRASGWGAGVTIVAQTGWGQAHDRQRTVEAGFDHHLVKPIDLDVLTALFPASSSSPALALTLPSPSPSPSPSLLPSQMPPAAAAASVPPPPATGAVADA